MPSTLDTLLSYLERRNLGLLDDIEDEADELEDEQETGSSQQWLLMVLATLKYAEH